MTHRANTIFESHSRCPTPGDCVCACPCCLMARTRYIERQRKREGPTKPTYKEMPAMKEMAVEYTDQEAIAEMAAIRGLMAKAHDTAKSKGWWEEPERTFGDQVALMHSELSEALEAFRSHGLELPAATDPRLATTLRGAGLYFTGPNGDKPDGIAAEFADVLIRIFDTCARYRIPLDIALTEKMRYNKTRPHKHGGKKI